jgi:hypothetical protein
LPWGLPFQSSFHIPVIKLFLKYQLPSAQNPLCFLIPQSKNPDFWVHQNCLESLLKLKFLATSSEFLIGLLSWMLRIYISNKFSGDASATGPGTKWKPPA